MHLFKIYVSQSNLKQFKSFKEILKDYLFDKFLNFIKTSMNYNFLSKKLDGTMKTQEKLKKILHLGFGEKKVLYLNNFTRLMQMLFSDITDKNILKRLLQVYYQSLNLRKLLSYSVRISEFTHSDLESMKRIAHLLFKACCLFDQRITPSF